MGSVLLAKDLRDGRKFAITVLTPGLGLGPERFLHGTEMAGLPDWVDTKVLVVRK